MAGSEDGGRWVGDGDVFHGEGAFWDDVAGVLRYVDMLAGCIITLDGARTVRTRVADVVALVRRRRAGGFVIATERGFALLDDELSVQRRIPVFDDPDVRMNEGGCDPRGRLICGSMAYDTRPGGGRLYRLDADGGVRVVLADVTIPNALVWTADGITALHADTGTGEIRALGYDLDAGEFGTARPHIRVPQRHGAPDGGALDVAGGLWVAMWGGGRVHRYDAAGRLDRVIELPVSNPTSCAFGGADGTTLFITTSRQGIPAGAEPLAGLVHVVDTPFRGATVHAFAG